jgi:hypothetical protein
MHKYRKKAIVDVCHVGHCLPRLFGAISTIQRDASRISVGGRVHKLHESPPRREKQARDRYAKVQLTGLMTDAYFPNSQNAHIFMTKDSNAAKYVIDLDSELRCWSPRLSETSPLREPTNSFESTRVTALEEHVSHTTLLWAHRSLLREMRSGDLKERCHNITKS